MKKKATSALIFTGAAILLLSALSLTGCYYLRPTGPCLGVGCPARTAGQSGQYKKNEGPKAQNAQNGQNGQNVQASKSPQTSQTPPKAGN
jgi:hypothetical protein